MKVFTSFNLLLSFIALLMLLATTSSHAEKGMNVPAIGSMVVMSGLENPWDVAFTPDGSMFYTEKCKGLSIKTSSGSTNALYGMKGSKGYKNAGDDLFCEGQAGMLGVELDPNFEKNRTLYLYSSSTKYHGSGCKTNFERCDGNIVMKFTVSKDLKSVSGRNDIVRDIQYKPFKSNQPFGGPGAHNGGRMRFGPDGYLYVGTGDRHRGVCPQDNSLLCGVVLRIDGNGKGHPENIIKADNRIYTYGHRNVQGLDFRPSDGQVFTAEHGPWHNDEITKLVIGGNGGWDPSEKVAGRGACPDEYCGYEPNQMEGMTPAVRAAYTPMSDTRFSDLMPPAWNNNGYSQGTGSAAFLKGSNWGIYEGRFATGIMGIGFGGTPGGMRIDMVDIAEDGLSVKSVIHMPTGVSKRFRGLRMGPENALFATTDEGEIYKISAQ
ncbi:MAG: PQQ-dependent sugar dehydrogenase [Proteobacteria bacterium]|nr:PQQ-dependent sugar dehydrogenase [Pseudomonadota bacterium]MDA1035083.1 PQQ-dependent sugar dehydrogenase [Pseudomonadota bacterium]